MLQKYYFHTNLTKFYDFFNTSPKINHLLRGFPHHFSQVLKHLLSLPFIHFFYFYLIPYLPKPPFVISLLFHLVHIRHLGKLYPFYRISSAVSPPIKFTTSSLTECTPQLNIGRAIFSGNLYSFSLLIYPLAVLLS